MDVWIKFRAVDLLPRYYRTMKLDIVTPSPSTKPPQIFSPTLLQISPENILQLAARQLSRETRAGLKPTYINHIPSPLRHLFHLKDISDYFKENYGLAPATKPFTSSTQQWRGSALSLLALSQGVVDDVLKKCCTMSKSPSDLMVHLAATEILSGP